MDFTVHISPQSPPDPEPGYSPFDLATWQAEQDALDLDEAWKDYHIWCQLLADLTAWARRLARQGSPSLLVSLKEFRAQCPMPPPTTRARVLSPWT